MCLDRFKKSTLYDSAFRSIFSVVIFSVNDCNVYGVRKSNDNVTFMEKDRDKLQKMIYVMVYFAVRLNMVLNI